jgi:hypothetical protein
MSFVIYLLGYLIFLAGVAWGLTVMHVPHTYVTIAVVVLLGIGIFTGVSRTRAKDPPQD